MTNELNLSRQSRLVPVDKISQWKIEVFGVGSVGSHTVKCLAKTGFKDIKVYDMDTVDEENIAAQAFDFKHIGMNKVDAMKDIVKDSTGVEIEIAHGMIDEKTDILPEPNTIYCCFFDSFEARKSIFDKLKDYPIIFVDARIGRYDMRHYLVDCSNKTYVENYAKSLDVTGVSELICGEKASAPINLQIAGRIVMNIVAYISGEEYIKVYIGNAMLTRGEIKAIEEKKVKEVVQSDATSDDISSLDYNPDEVDDSGWDLDDIPSEDTPDGDDEGMM